MAHLTIQDLFHPFEQLPAEACLGPPELPANQGMLVRFVGPNGNVDMEPLRIHIDASVFELRVRICLVRKCSMENVQLLVGSTMLNDHDTLEQFNGSELGGNMTMTLIVGQDQVVSLCMPFGEFDDEGCPRPSLCIEKLLSVEHGMISYRPDVCYGRTSYLWNRFFHKVSFRSAPIVVFESVTFPGKYLAYLAGCDDTLTGEHPHVIYPIGLCLWDLKKCAWMEKKPFVADANEARSYCLVSSPDIYLMHDLSTCRSGGLVRPAVHSLEAWRSERGNDIGVCDWKLETKAQTEIPSGARMCCVARLMEARYWVINGYKFPSYELSWEAREVDTQGDVLQLACWLLSVRQ